MANGQADTSVVRKVPIVQYPDYGFALTTRDSNYQMHIEWRGQFRFAYPTDNDPVTLRDFDQNKIHININRARMKVGGHAYKPYIKCYLEYELFSANLLDFRFMFEKFSFLKLKVGQWMQEFAFKIRGVSLQQEFHWKHINDMKNETQTTLLGNLVQVGYFPHHIVPKFPKPIEVYLRHANYDPDNSVQNDLQNEFSFGLNWFVHGHRNKFTAEMSFFN